MASATELSPYRYEPLAEGEFRLLVIQSARKREDVVCGISRLKPTEIDYIAISYAWEPGGEDELVSIPLTDVLDVAAVKGDRKRLLLCSDRVRWQMTVKASLWKMILAVGNGGEEEDDDKDDNQNDNEDKANDNVDEVSRPDRSMVRAVWIDQVCIDQYNTEEKSAQVRIMHHIYRRARATIVYLGDPTSKTAIGLEAALVLASLLRLDDDAIPIERVTRGHKWQRPLKRIDWAAAQDAPDYTPMYCKFIRGIKLRNDRFVYFASDILGRRWWSRTWVVQEVVCSRVVIVMLGRRFITWGALLAACEVAERLGYRERYTGNNIVQEIWALEDLRQDYLVTANATLADQWTVKKVKDLYESIASRTMSRILPRFIYKDVSDPRDKVLAVLNIASETMREENRTRFFALVDYNLPVRTIYIRACELWYAESKTKFAATRPGESIGMLSFLDYVFDTTENDKISLPSWVPHWMQRGPMVMTKPVGCEAAIRPDMSPFPVNVQFPSPDQYASEEVPLGVRGIKLFTVHQASALVDIKRLAGHVTMLSAFSGLYPTTKMSYLEAYSRAIVPEPHQFKCAGERTCSFWDYMKDHPTDTYCKEEAGSTMYALVECLDAIPKGLLLSVDRGGQYLAVKRSFITTTNGFIGLAPAATEPGDDIVLFFGGRTPYVIRRLQSGGYRFIGSCFLLGVMQGEALCGYPEEQVTDFVLV